MKKIMILLVAAALLTGCSKKNTNADAYGNFEATDVIVAAEATGKLLSFQVQEGNAIAAGQVIGIIDTTFLALQRLELVSQKQVLKSQLLAAEAQIAMVQQKEENLSVDLKRVQKMVKDDAATQKQLDDLTGAEKVLQKQVEATRAQRNAVAEQIKALDAKASLLDEQLARCQIANPLSGIVLEKYVEAFEMTAAGKPLYKIADLSSMTLKVYVSGGQLHSLKLGTECTVRIDDGKKYIDYPGCIKWISNQAEFTPKIIQTKEECVDLVYAVKIGVENSGAIKIGMPGEVIFSSTNASK
jgi:HlyD family secretion protein